MAAFKDSGHFWWQQCPTCEMAWFVGNPPEDEEEDVECARCSADGNSAEQPKETP